MRRMKSVVSIHGPGSRHWVGDGFEVRNLFPSNGLGEEVSPFLMLDYAGPTRFTPTDERRGVGEHPHRGFETVTIVYQGAVEHRDSAGNAGTIGPGDVQWMTAASGVVHEEFHEREFARRGGTFEVAQLWVNLPRAHKMTRPRYQALTAGGIPVVDLSGGGTARVIAGAWDGVRGPAYTVTPMNVFDVRLPAGATFQLPLPAGHNAAVVLLAGDVRLHDADVLQGTAKIAVLDRDGDGVSGRAVADSLLLVLSGEPIEEPVASHGPFVMNTREELVAAVNDYRTGKMGVLQ